MGKILYKRNIHNPRNRWPYAERVIDFDSCDDSDSSFLLTAYGNKLQADGFKIGFPDYYNGKLRCECIHRSEL